MTVLDENTSSTLIMSSGLGGDRYITPEYLAPLPQKDGLSDKSPLQMLAQTCSQIGADTGHSKMTGSSSGDKSKVSSSKSKNTTSTSPVIVVSENNSSSVKPVPFKPYEPSSGPVTPKCVENKRMSESSSTKSTSPHNTDTRSPRDVVDANGNKSVSPKHSTSSASDSSSTTPIMSSGLEILAGHPKDLPLGANFRPAPGVPGLLDPMNPAFRLPSTIPGLPGFPPPTPSSSAAGAAVCRDPYCKDPGCPTAVYNAYMATARMRLPPGYLELLEAHKLASLGGAPPGLPPTLPPSSLSASASLGPGGPYICNWMNGRDYCGKRYSSAEELLVHLKTHTNLSTSDPGPGSSIAPGYSAALLSQSLIRAAGASQILPSPLSLQAQANRYSPYQRPSSAAALPPTLSSLGAMPPSPLTGLPPSLASSLPYPASLYALYGARL